MNAKKRVKFMIDAAVPYKGETPEATIRALSDEYSAWFAEKYPKAPNKTAWHFFMFILKVYKGGRYDVSETRTLNRHFHHACIAAGKKPTWGDAVRWWILDEEGMK